MESHFIRWRSSTIHYNRLGHGSEWLFCFHGYGEQGSSFDLFEELLGDAYSLIAIDLPFHGQTDWQEGLSFPVVDLIQIIDQIKPPGAGHEFAGLQHGRQGMFTITTKHSRTN